MEKIKKWNEPKLKALLIEHTLERPEKKCTNNNGNEINCIRNPRNIGYYEGPMFYCEYYEKNGHLCNSSLDIS